MTNRTITHLVQAQTQSEGAGATVHRTIGAHGLDVLDPFLLLDEFTAVGGDGGGFPDHPHRGFETVTYMLDGRIEHADNKGHRGVIGPGAIQWMTAGRGIIHSEFPVGDVGAPIRGLQLWLNLPAAQKMKAPRYQELDAPDIPLVTLEGAQVRVLAGEFGETEGAAKDIATAPLYLDVTLEPGAEVEVPLPGGHQAFLYGLEGLAFIEGEPLESRKLAILSEGDVVRFKGGSSGARFILVAACPLNEPVARYGPFVMNTREEIREAFQDYQAGRL